MNPRAYLDYNASAPLLPEARDAMLAMMDAPGNASSVHREGRAQRSAVDAARRSVAALVGGKPDNVVFTSGATEAAALLLTPDWTLGRAALPFPRLLAGATEHPCIREGGRFQADSVSLLPVDENGLIRRDGLDAALALCVSEGVRPLVAIQMANNETGVIQDINTLAQVIHGVGGFLICDCAQAAGRLPLDIASLGADAIILSAHKLGGPKGAGAIVFAGEIMRPRPVATGGGQERGFRSGTENAAALAGFGAAAAVALGSLQNRAPIAALRAAFEAKLKSLRIDAVIHGDNASRLDNTSFVTLPGMKAETAMIAFDLAGIAVSSGSACSSGKVGRSAVLDAMGVDDGFGALRFSFGPQNTMQDIDRAMAVAAKFAPPA
jgi:cysteine desulfurase